MTTDLQATASAPLPPAPPPPVGPGGARVGAGRATGARALDEAWDRLGDGLFTYCLSVLCDQAEAVAAVREVRQLSVRHRRRLRRPELLRAWLYALARHVCLVRMEEADPVGTPPRPAGRHSAEHGRLAVLGWPEAAGVTPVQREALELAGRHGLRPAELGAVLDLRTEQAGALLAQAVCELERTAAALAVLSAEACPELGRIGRGRGPVLGTALRGELVRHVDACPTCRGTAERAAARGPWPGTLRAPGSPALVTAPPEARRAPGGEGFFAALGAGRGEGRGEGREENRDPRFDRRGFPVHRTARAVRATMLRQRAVASTVIALVVAAPVMALWVSHQGSAPAEDPVSSVRVDSATPVLDPAPTDGGARSATPSLQAPAPGAAAPAPAPAPAVPPPSAVTGDPGAGSAAAAPATLTVTASEQGGRTVVTLVNSGTAAVSWRAAGTADWLRLSRDSGTLQPGQRFTLLVTIDQAALPEGPWTAQVAVAPSGSVVVLHGPGRDGGRRGMPPPSPAPSSSTGAPAPPASQGPTPTPTPTPDPTVTPTQTPTPTPTASTSASTTPDPTGSVPAPRGRHRGPSAR
ncbi:sigma-70 family RNA polymerase sigma factor [Streptacidiphilus sp. N1-3]|uniref:Sigma-70 family RNA polymerase sigma factor n=1 Tax=Streptacidiphilus alkalitolerans TaxID=3342712 RepID=A0ABV6WXP0_9ACTN